MEPQVASAERMYDARAPTYDASWHPDYSRHFVELADPQPGQRVLDLCCGTGLEAFLTAERIGPAGQLVGVDISPGMLAVAEQKLQAAADPALARRVRFVRHDVTADDLAEAGGGVIARGSFDLLMCSNAFVLFTDPAAVVRSWRAYLRPGGVMVVDVAHEHNFRQGILLERAAAAAGVAWPSRRAWIRSEASFRAVLEAEGMVVERVELLDKVAAGPRSLFLPVNEADAVFDFAVASPLSATVEMDAPARERLRAAFKDEFAREAVDGRLEVVEALYVYVARRKP